MELNLQSIDEIKKHIIKTEGYWIYYSDGSRSLEIQCGNGAFVLGYSNTFSQPDVKFLRGNSGESCEANDELVNLICSEGNWDSLCWTVSGSDAVETAIAMNDTYWKNIGTLKHKILCFSPNYHGATMLTKHLRGEYPYINRAVFVELPIWTQQKRQKLMETLALDNVRNTLVNDSNIGCILMESISWVMSDMTSFTQYWWESIRALCDEFNVLFIVDDVAVCWGKNGTLFGWQQYGVQPDISSLGKALTAGYSPLGAAVCNNKVSQVINNGTWAHSYTWSPNMQGVVTALEATKEIKRLLPKVPYIGESLGIVAKSLNATLRGSGLMFGLGLGRNINLAELASVGLSAGIKSTDEIKLVIPLIADDEYFKELQIRLHKLLNPRSINQTVN